MPSGSTSRRLRSRLPGRLPANFGEPAQLAHPITYQWQHTLGDVVSAIVGSGLHLEYLHEWPVAEFRAVKTMQRGEDGYWHLADDRWPFLFSVKAQRAFE